MRVTPRAQRHADRAGDPLDGLVNMFDLGLVLAVAFLLAALQSLDITDLLTKRDITLVRQTPSGQAIIVKRGEQLRTLRLSGQRTAGSGARVGSVFRLADGRLVYVTGR
ncbi:DUF2149 domain-containing protein [Conexibacter sp. CPCC 206217]|uniref:DUF2149 domain-containing protein n=1 Tax=Conexibacter sp. CPCC 206217 TaxID=3064574 RepID=UPI0027252CAF|nr:DUF2149 domain-containing protein [Conexibacter sp. CPCC 206217]MDO8211689.1 DUF2149 domain-containing protein [Conexibacter sp. CPCC 206217]